MKLSVELTGALETQLAAAARRLGVAPEQLAAAAVRDLLAQREADFDAAARHVLAKNRALYERLAQRAGARPLRYLSLAEVLALHALVVGETGGAGGVRDLGALESAVAQPRASFGGEPLYPTLAAQAAALCVSLVGNHPFVDGNKRVGHAALETTLVLNGSELTAGVDDAERTMLALAAGALTRAEFVAWVERHVRPLMGAG